MGRGGGVVRVGDGQCGGGGGAVGRGRWVPVEEEVGHCGGGGLPHNTA